MAGVLDRTGFTFAHLVRFSWTVGANALQVNLKSCGSTVSVDNIHASRIVSVSDLVNDNDGPSRCAVTLRYQGPFTVWNSTAGAWWANSYTSWGDLVGEFPQVQRTATVLVRMEVGDLCGNAWIDTLLTGNVRSISHCDGFTITLEIEQTNATDLVEIPTNILSRSVVPASWRDYLDKDCTGEPFPLVLGDPLPAAITPLGGEWFRYRLGVLGLKVPMNPTIRTHRWVSGGTWRDVHAWTESVSGLSVYASDTSSTSYVKASNAMAMRYEYWVDAGGTPRGGDPYLENWSEPNATYLSGAYTHLSSVRPWVMVPIIPEPVGTDNTANAAKAVDRDTMTYATIAYNQTVYWELSNSANAGRISMNSTDSGTAPGSVAHDPVDREGQYAPVGLKICALLVMPPGGTAPGAGSVTLGLCYADGTSAISSPSTFSPPSSGYVLGQHNIPYERYGDVVGEEDAGWAGTKFSQWQFTNAPSNQSPNAPLYTASMANKELPFRIKITNGNSSPIYVMAVALVVGCKLNTEARTSGTGGKIYGYTITGRKEKDEAVFTASQLVNAAFASDMRAQNQYAERGETMAGINRRERGSVPTVSDVFTARPSYRDNSVGTYTGTAYATLREPIHFARLLVEKYCGGTVATSGHGNYADARTMLNTWHNYGSDKWQMHFAINSRQSAREVLDSVCEDCMGLNVRRLPGGTYAFTHWFPVEGMLASRYYGGSAATCTIDIDRVVVASNGMPQIEFSRGDIATVVNDLEVTYGTDGMHVARASGTVDDDGTGAALCGGYVPHSSVSLSELCAASISKFGARPTKRLTMKHVEDRIVVGRIMAYIIGRHWEPEKFLRMTCLPKLYDLYPGSMFVLDTDMLTRYNFTPPFWPFGAIWNGIYWMCLSNEQRSDSGMPLHEITAVCLPYRIAQEVSGFAIAGQEAGTLEVDES